MRTVFGLMLALALGLLLQRYAPLPTTERAVSCQVLEVTRRIQGKTTGYIKCAGASDAQSAELLGWSILLGSKIRCTQVHRLIPFLHIEMPDDTPAVKGCDTVLEYD